MPHTEKKTVLVGGLCPPTHTISFTLCAALRPFSLHRVPGELFFISGGVLFDIFCPSHGAAALQGRTFVARGLRGRTFRQLGEDFSRTGGGLFEYFSKTRGEDWGITGGVL